MAITEIAVPTILTVDIQTTSRAVDLAVEALAKDVATSVVDTDFIANSKVEVEAMTIILAAATYREVIYVEVTLRTKGLVMDITMTTHVNSLESTTSATRKATSLYNTLQKNKNVLEAALLYT
jgi:hypothetical protein